MTIVDKGLNLSNPDATSPDEYDEFRAFYLRTKGYVLPAFEFWAEFRPDVLKRYRLQAVQTPNRASSNSSLATTLAFLHWYVALGYEAGILYEMRTARALGCTRAQILETMAVAFLHSGPRGGTRFVSEPTLDYLREYSELDIGGDPFPAEWGPDPEAFKAGLDFSTPSLSHEELASLQHWHLHYEGELPGYVRFLAEFNPTLLKSFRHRFENSIRTALPKQMMPTFMIHFEVGRGHAEGIREGVLLARGFGMSKVETVDAISWGMLYGGSSAISVVEVAIGDILRNWK